MRILLQARMPNQRFNAAVREGTVGKKLNKILEELEPETVYFTETAGCRTAMLILELDDASRIPAVAEPWFLAFDAEVEFHPVMLPDDLKRSGIDAMGKKWG